MYPQIERRFMSDIENQAFHEGLKASMHASNPYKTADSPHAARAWSKGNQLAFRLNARIAVQYLNASRHQ
ncbi:hypothetical protein [Bermanella sp. R86510]|uniref:hypothetical protein n=1 Tax=unclassified Bermanella TaxID=2627862 RepID=UPI0037C83B82